MKVFILSYPRSGALCVSRMVEKLTGLTTSRIALPVHLPGIAVGANEITYLNSLPEGIYTSQLITPTDIAPPLIGNKNHFFIGIHRDFQDVLLSELLYLRTTFRKSAEVNFFDKRWNFLDNNTWVNLFIEANPKWLKNRVRHYKAFQKKLWASNATTLRYEKFVDSPDDTIKHLSTFLNQPLDFDTLESVLQYSSIPASRIAIGDDKQQSGKGHIRFGRSGMGELFFDDAIKTRIELALKQHN